MNVREERSPGALIFGLSNRLDSTTARGVGDKILGAIDAGEHRIALDLTELEFISSAGLRLLLLIVSRLKPHEGRIALFGVNQHVRHVFDIAGITGLLAVSSSREDALARIQ